MERPSRWLVRPLNHVLTASPWATERLRLYAGAVVTITAGSLALTLQIDSSGMFRELAGASAGDAAGKSAQADVSIALPDDFVLQAVVDRGNLLGKAKLSGQADVAETLAFVFRNLSWDVEGDLARVVGDIAAHRLVRIGRQLVAGASTGSERMLSNVAEYLAEKPGMIVPAEEVSRFGLAVDELRNDLARLEKRIGRL